MKTLYILRHAKSSWKDPALSDHQRPLNKRGKRDVPVMGARLEARSIRPDRILCSDARRSLDTATPIAKILGLDSSFVQLKPGLYHASQAHILKLISRLKDSWQRVMVVGHNPGLNDVANTFLAHPIANLPTAGIVELRFEINAWRDIDPHRLVHSSFDFPKNVP